MNVPYFIHFLIKQGGAHQVTRFAYNGAGLVEYVGIAPRGSATSAAVWFIYRMTYSGNNVTVIETTPNDDQVYDDRASATYA